MLGEQVIAVVEALWPQIEWVWDGETLLWEEGPTTDEVAGVLGMPVALVRLNAPDEEDGDA